MKKNIAFVALDSSLVRWMLEQLQKSKIAAPSAQELSEGLRDLMDGTAGSLMLELGEGEMPSGGGDTICCGVLTIDLRLRRVSRDGAEISLTPKEFDILYFLARNRGEVFTKEQIYQAVWENDYLLDDSNIMAFIRKLRKNSGLIMAKASVFCVLSQAG